MLDLLHSNNIVVGKLPASTTSFTQPCDVGNCFKATKTALKNLNAFEFGNNPRMLQLIEAVFQEHHKRKVNAIGATAGLKPIAAEIRRRMAHGLLRVQRAQECIRHGTISRSFADCGIYPYNASLILQKCATKLRVSVMNNILTSLPALAALFRTQGELSDTDMDTHNIPTTRPLDHLVIYRRRAVLLTHASVIEKEKEKAFQKSLGTKRAVVSRVDVLTGGMQRIQLVLGTPPKKVKR